MSKYTGKYQFRYHMYESEPFDSEEAVFSWAEKLENSDKGGYVYTIEKDSEPIYVRWAAGTDVWWKSVETGEEFEGYRRPV